MLRGRTQGGRVLNRSLAAGNRGVFFEIGLCWADFLATFGRRELTDDEMLAEFQEFSERIDRLSQPPGKLWPEGDRGQLKKGFAAYLEAMSCPDPKRKAELILLGNICMGDHEQRRLQGWLDLSLLDPIRILAKPARRIGLGRHIGKVETRLVTGDDPQGVRGEDGTGDGPRRPPGTADRSPLPGAARHPRRGRGPVGIRAHRHRWRRRRRRARTTGTTSTTG